MPLESRTQRSFLYALQQGSPTYTFSGAIAQALYGLSGFSLSFPDSEGHNVGTMAVSTGLSKVGSSDITLNITMTLVDNGGNQADPNSSYCNYTVLAWTGTDNSVCTLANSGLLPSGDTDQPSLASTNPMTAYAPVFSGFHASYQGGDNQVLTVSDAVTANANSGLLTLSGAMFDNDHKHDATCTVDGGLVAAFVEHPGFLVKTMTRQQTSDTVACDFSSLLQPQQKLAACAVFLMGFQVSYAKGKAHDVNTIRIGLQGSDHDGNPYIDGSGKKVMIPGPKATMWDCGWPSNNTQDDDVSWVDLAVIGIPSLG